MMSYEQQFRDHVERYLAKSGMAPTKFGIEAVRDPRFVFDLREGRSCGSKLMDRINAWIIKREKGRA